MTHLTWILSGNWGTNLINKAVQDYNQKNPTRFDSPESGTVMPVTFEANDCNELYAKLPGRSPPRAG